MKKTIFIIEDEDMYRMFLESQLTNYETMSFPTAEDCLTELIGNRPDAILIDYNLPGISGYEFFEKVQSKLPDTMLIIMSSMEDGQKVLDLVIKGVRNYVIKDEHIIPAITMLLEEGKDYYEETGI